MTLSEAKDGQLLRVTGCASDEITCQALRFGIGEGSLVRVQKNITNGPVIVTKNQLEIALGRRLAQAISVELCEKQ